MTVIRRIFLFHALEFLKHLLGGERACLFRSGKYLLWCGISAWFFWVYKTSLTDAIEEIGGKVECTRSSTTGSVPNTVEAAVFLRVRATIFLRCKDLIHNRLACKCVGRFATLNTMRLAPIDVLAVMSRGNARARLSFRFAKHGGARCHKTVSEVAVNIDTICVAATFHFFEVPWWRILSVYRLCSVGELHAATTKIDSGHCIFDASSEVAKEIVHSQPLERSLLGAIQYADGILIESKRILVE
mmetsp:Transcript_9291/g.40811  ORF Transcript_9291/g.40811 Transcript_9291/m.40811 type:complete len:244 (+) Transcript_9291:1732-2463(+)